MTLHTLARKAHIAWLGLMARRAPEFAPQGCVAIVAPHPDDEVLGCGGLIARLVAEGRAPHIIVMTGGEGSHSACCGLSSAELKAARRSLTRDALAILGLPAENIHELDYADGGITDADHGALAALLAALRPDTILIPHWGEGWPDHTGAARLARKAAVECGLTAVQIVEYCVWMWYYNVWRGLDWPDAAALRLTHDEQQLKRAATDAYVLPAAPCGTPWSGNLPPLFLAAHRSPLELYFRAR